MEPLLIVDATGEQITVAEARRHCNITPEGSPPTHEDDPLLEDILIPAVREWAEHYTGQIMAPKTYELAIDAFPDDGDIRLPVYPVRSVVSIKYIDDDENEITLNQTDYSLDDRSVPNWILRPVGTSWPTAKDAANAVKIQVVAGYSLPEDPPPVRILPRTFKMAMLMGVVHCYENRGIGVKDALATMPLGAIAMLDAGGRVRRGWA